MLCFCSNGNISSTVALRRRYQKIKVRCNETFTFFCLYALFKKKSNVIAKRIEISWTSIYFSLKICHKYACGLAQNFNSTRTKFDTTENVGYFPQQILKKINIWLLILAKRLPNFIWKDVPKWLFSELLTKAKCCKIQ